MCQLCDHIQSSCPDTPFIPSWWRFWSINWRTYTCPRCGQHWWQYNDYYHRWRPIPEETFQAIRNRANVAIDINTGLIAGPGGD